MAQIHELIGKAMNKIGAIGKDSRNNTQGFMYRGIDAVYNALNPVMSELGLFICPEVIDQKREERTTKNGTAITYTILTIKYTVFAPDGSNITLTVVGEGMDSGDKSTNKAMSIAMKYAMFQLFFIPTEELKDPDAESYSDIQPKRITPTVVNATTTYAGAPANTSTVVSIANKLPEASKETKIVHIPKAEDNPVQEFLIKAMQGLRENRGISASQNNKLFKEQRETLIKAKLAPDKPLQDYTMEEAEALIDAMNKCFTLTGTELKTQ